MKICNKILNEKEFEKNYGVSFEAYCDIFPLSFSLFVKENPLKGDYPIRDGIFACVDFLYEDKEKELLEKFKNNDKIIDLIKREDIDYLFISIDTTSKEEEFIVEIAYNSKLNEYNKDKISKEILNSVDSIIVLDNKNNLNVTIYEKDFEKIIKSL